MNKGLCVFVVGFMASGKTTVGRLLAKRLDRSFADTDDLIEEKTGMRIRELFEREGEARFRDIERVLLLDLENAAGTSGGTSGGVAGVAEGAGCGNRLGCLLSDLAAGRGAVIATGGGLPCGSGNMRMMKEFGTVVYLRAGVDDIEGRLSRMSDGADRPVFRKLKGRALEKQGAGTAGDSSSEGHALREELSALLAAREPFYLEADVVVENGDAQNREKTVSRIVEALSALEPLEEA